VLSCLEIEAEPIYSLVRIIFVFLYSKQAEMGVHLKERKKQEDKNRSARDKKTSNGENS
jgi:hypothetical protein